MADVKLSVAGRSYDVHCADGQEAQLLHLASVVDAKARDVQGGTEVRQLLFAALMLADEMGETARNPSGDSSQIEAARAATARAEGRMAEMQDQLQAAIASEAAALEQLHIVQQNLAPPAASNKPAHDRALLQIADRIETLAARVEQAS